MVTIQPTNQKGNFDIGTSRFQKIARTFLRKNRKKSAVKHSMEKPILLNFANLSTILSPRQ